LIAGQHGLPNPQVEFAHALAPLLQMDEEKLFQLLLPRLIKTRTANGYEQYAVLKRDVTDETWQKIQRR